MLKMQRYFTTIAMFAALVGGLAFAAAPARADLTPSDLGTEYAAQTGLSSTDVRVTIARIIKVAMSLLGIIAVVIILIGGFTWMTAGGNDEKVGEAKKWIFAGIIGLAIIFSAYALANFVINQLINATNSDQGVKF